MNDNTILRIKVPAHLYESVKEQLTLNEAKKGKHNYGAGMEVVKEKKLPKDGMKKVEEKKDEIEEVDDKNPQPAAAPKDKISKVLANPTVIAALKALNVAIANKQDYAKLLVALADKIKAGEGDAFAQSIDSNPSFKRADQNLDSVSGDTTKKEAKEKEEEKPLKEDIFSDPNFWGGIGGILLGSVPILKALYDEYTAAKTPEEKQSVLSKAKDAIAKSMGGTNEAKEEVEEAKEEDVKKNLKEYEVIYVVRDGKCYRKDDEGNMDEVDMRKCR